MAFCKHLNTLQSGICFMLLASNNIYTDHLVQSTGSVFLWYLYSSHHYQTSHWKETKIKCKPIRNARAKSVPRDPNTYQLYSIPGYIFLYAISSCTYLQLIACINSSWGFILNDSDYQMQSKCAFSLAEIDGQGFAIFRLFLLHLLSWYMMAIKGFRLWL